MITCLESNGKIFRVGYIVHVTTWKGLNKINIMGRLAEIHHDHIIVDCSEIQQSKLIKIDFDNMVSIQQVGVTNDKLY